MTEAEHEAMLSGEIVTAVRQAANDVTGGNCAFADDDVAILAHLAHRAVAGGLTDRLHPQIQRRIAKRAASCDRNPKGEKPQALSAQHESAVDGVGNADGSETPEKVSDSYLNHTPDHSSETPVE